MKDKKQQLGVECAGELPCVLRDKAISEDTSGLTCRESLKNTNAFGDSGCWMLGLCWCGQ